MTNPRIDLCSSLGLNGGGIFHRVLFRARNRFRALVEQRGFEKLDLFMLALLGVCMSTTYSAMAFWPFAIRMM